mmetsp:Transcript_17286/g.53668  ORF Transcript_17286/g.53668 Transcript_17286/m.53668 type:complete len:156 (+) Transcript_17286:417-884(+)
MSAIFATLCPTVVNIAEVTSLYSMPSTKSRTVAFTESVGPDSDGVHHCFSALLMGDVCVMQHFSGYSRPMFDGPVTFGDGMNQFGTKGRSEHAQPPSWASLPEDVRRDVGCPAHVAARSPVAVDPAALALRPQATSAVVAHAAPISKPWRPRHLR